MNQLAIQPKAAMAIPAPGGAALGQSSKDAALLQEVLVSGTSEKELRLETPASVGGQQARPVQLRLVAPAGTRRPSQNRLGEKHANQAQAQPKGTDLSTSSLIIGAGLTLASLIVLPALAQHIGIGASLTSALRVALMRAASRV